MSEIRAILTARERADVRALAEGAGLRVPERLDALYGVYDGETLLGCGGYRGRVIECVAVRGDARGAGVMSAIVSHLVAELKGGGADNLFVFTKPAHAEKFIGLGFTKLVTTADAALLESRRDGLARWLFTLPQPETERNGAIVLHANPFTKGHRYLIESAAKRCETLYAFVLSEDASRFCASERLDMVQKGCADLPNVRVVAGGDYCISNATFPDYFIKCTSDSSRVYAALDAALFSERIAPALRIRTRFLGSEPTDALTNQYNETLCALLPERNVEARVLERLTQSGAPVSASRVRALLDAPDFAAACALVPATSRPHLIGQLAYEAMALEARATPKPGLVDSANSGAHRDMNLTLLLHSAAVIRPYLRRFAELGGQERALPLTGGLSRLRPLGMEAERAMLKETGGVNTHRGAIFTLGVFCYLAGRADRLDTAALCADAARLCKGLTAELRAPSASNGGRACAAHGATGIRGEAEGGYPSLVHVALPTLRERLASGTPREDALTWTLLRLIAITQDTNLLHRGGPDGLSYARLATSAFLAAHSTEDADYRAALSALDAEFIRRNLSPGGAADLLAAAWLLHSLCDSPIPREP